MALYVDGVLDGEVDGPDGDLSYRDGRPSGLPNDPFLVIGAEKFDANPSANPSFRGGLDEIRFSTVFRYAAPFATPSGPFGSDGDTSALYHFDEGFGNTIGDAAGAAGGPSQGLRVYGGIVNGPEWTSDSPWYVAPTPTATLGTPATTAVATATATPTQTRTPTRTPTPSNTASPTATATATATATTMRFAVVGDYGYEGPAALDVSNLIKSWNPQFILTLGDNNYPDGQASTIDDNIGQYYSDFIFPYTGAYGSSASVNRFFPVLGNHDWITAGAQPYLDYFTLPGNERYYDFVVGPVQFFALDSDPSEPDGIAAGSVQGAWLQSALAASTARWQVVLMHHPPYSSGDHGSVGMQWPYAAWGADAVLAGHDHTYERLRADGIPYFVNGLGGRSIYGFNNPLPETQFRYNADYGAMRVDASSSQISFQFLDRAGALVDTFVLTPQPATPTPTLTATVTPTRTATSTPTPTFTSTPTITLTPTPQLPGDIAPGLNFQTVASGFSEPLFVTHAGDQSGRLFVVQRGGQIRILLPSGTIVSPAYLNLSSLITTSGSEQGVLGMAFHPDYVNNGLFYVTYNNTGGAIVLARYRVSTTNPDQADTSTASILLTIPKPYSNHNGGMIAFGDDGMLYMSTGDGGGGGDPLGSGQSRTTLLGKILRLDVDSASPYAVPTDNPFYNDSNPAVREEIWDYGFRNPWRFSFDRSTGDLWIGDVGQGNREEIDFEASASAGGRNYGWNVMEGTWCYSPSSGCDTTGKVLPVIDYNTHDTGNCAVTGGYIYRGTRYPSLWGVYFYADYCSGKLWALAQQTPGTWTGGLVVDTSYFVSSFGEDEAGELYLTDYAGGRVVRIQGSDPAPTPTPTVTPVFGDVPASHWAHDYIEALFNAGYIAGCSATPRLYCPLSNMARAEGAVFVVRGVHGGGFLPPDPGSQVFGDVPLSQWYARWANTLYLDGYTAGCSASPLLFCPLQAHTRAEAAVFYLRMLNGPAYIPPDPTSVVFTDVPLTAWYARWVNAAYTAGLLLPCQTTPVLRYCPDSPLTRDVGAYMMVQAKGGLPLP
jgi:glucose/arabinose dehydrogenase